MPSILLINGPNINLLGTREPHLYGTVTLSNVQNNCSEISAEHGVEFDAIQSNHEGVIIDRIHEVRGKVDYIIINAGAFTHSSVAIRDALAGVAIPFIEVHITNIYARESFRHHGYLSDKAVACIVGLGTYGYEAAMHFAIRKINERAKEDA
jgi:3-dehydroquinate dehydratase-2